MNRSLFKRFTLERSLIYILIGAVLAVFVFIFYLVFSYGIKGIEILTPNGGEEWAIGETHQISWKARGIERVGIVLFQGTEPKWIAKNVDAKLRKYEWKIYPGQEYRDDYWVAIFEYPWQKGNKIDYSNGAFAIIYPELGSCDKLSIENEWLYLPSDFPNLRRVFITENSFTGNLGGLEGADKKCQEEAEKRGFGGKWFAFLGGESDQDLAVARLKRTPRKAEGVFVEAKPSAILIRQATCHRLLAKDFNEFFSKFSELLIINETKFKKEFLENFGSLWLGRVDEKSKKNCAIIFSVASDPYKPLAEKYSFTTSCQNWTQESNLVQGYPVATGESKPSFPTCYTPEGKFTEAVALAGLSSGLTGGGKETNSFTAYQGKYCNNRQRLLCIEE